VAHDGSNDDGNQNYKLVPWERIAAHAQPPLVVDTCHDPRAR
jgi:myo-inositol-hexaphosphate 3-phosphohydrolase